MSSKLLLDVDPGCDDAVTMSMALAADDIEVIGITTVAGNSTVENTTRNALAVLELLDRTDVPVARGAVSPLIDDLTTAEWVHGSEGIRGDLPEPTTETVEEHAVEFMIEKAREHGSDLTLVSTAMLTNLATALVLEPDLPEMVSQIRLMGGAAMTVGNTTPMAEANFHNDPVAAKRVVRSVSPWVAGLDAIDDATVPSEVVEEYKVADPPLDAVGAWMDYPEEVRQYGNTNDPIVHDAAVGADLIDDVLTYEPYYIDVDTSEGPSRGAVVCDKYGVYDEETNAKVAVDINVEAFRRVLRDTVEAL